MAATNSALCIYAIAQLGNPYWYGTAGAKASSALYKQLKARFPKYYKWAYSSSVSGKKVHDCSGLVYAAFKNKNIAAHGATSLYTYNCTKKSKSMKDFPYDVPGTLVFLKDGASMSHVGVYIGTFTDAKGKKHTNAVVEAKSHKYGVVLSDVSHWDAWGQLKKCTIDTKGMTFQAGQTNTLNPQDLIKVDTFSPYVAIVHPGNTSIDYSMLKNAKVSAMMFSAGGLYDASHKKKTYKNPSLDKQVKGCVEANLPFALYADVRSINEIEADEECRSLYYIISEHPPKLGIWLRMNTGQGASVNDKIINVYYKYIERWGLKGRCGIYIDMAKLSTISWSKFQDTFYLLGIDRSLDLKKVENKLLQPSMFEVPD